MTSTLAKQATAARNLASRAKRLAATLIEPEDVDRLLRYAEELEDQAVDLDRRANEGG
jgi:hypothetical protein